MATRCVRTTWCGSRSIRAAVNAAALSIKGGKGGMIRGLGLSGAGIGLIVNGTQDLTIDRVRVNGATGMGLYATGAKNLIIKATTVRSTASGKVGTGTSAVAMGLVLSNSTTATLSLVLVEQNQQVGLLASDSVVNWSTSAVLDNGGKKDQGSMGVTITCSSVAACQTLRTLGTSKLTGVELLRNYGVSFALTGSKAILSKIRISESKGAGDLVDFARSLQVAAYRKKEFPVKTGEYFGADLELSDSVIDKGEGLGVIVELSSAKLTNNVISQHKERGVWLQSIEDTFGQKVLLDGNKVEDNALIGIGSTGADNVTIKGGAVSRTKLGLMLVGGSSLSMGDGIQVIPRWYLKEGETTPTSKASKIAVTAVTLAQNDRASVLIDKSTGTVDNCKVDRKDPAKDVGILAQNSGKVQASGNKDGQGKPLAPVTVPGTKLAIDPFPLFMPAATQAPAVK